MNDHDDDDGRGGECAMRERIEERLLTAELVAVMADEQPPIAARRPSLLAAAMVLFGAFVAFGVAWLARDERAPLQGRAFDPVDPWYEHEWPLRSMVDGLSQPGRAAEAPTGEDTFLVTMRDEDTADLAAVLDRPTVRRLGLFWRNDLGVPNVSPELWQRIAVRPELETLLLAGRFAMPAERLRELRLASALRYVMLWNGAVALDRRTVEALAELPRLRGIGLAALRQDPIGVSAETLAMLASLPELDTVFVATPHREDVHALLAALPKLRRLRALVCECGMAIDSKAWKSLASMDNLRALDLPHVVLDDAALACLPPRLELLGLSSLDRCTVEGLNSLRRLKLRTLRLRAGLPTPLRPALPALLADLGLERFDGLTDAPDQTTWQALQSLPKLRWLSLRQQGASFEALIAGSRACANLEVLMLKGQQLPTPEQLAPLRDHPTLRRIVLQIDFRDHPVADLDQRRVALQAAVRARIDFDVR